METYIGKSEEEIQLFLTSKLSKTKTEELILLFLTHKQVYKEALQATFPEKSSTPSSATFEALEHYIKRTRPFNINPADIDFNTLAEVLFM